MHAGTTVDNFLRKHLEWLGKATNWAKFSATAGLGVIHKGHLTQGAKLLAPYLPRAGVTSGSPFSEGGALYALGLIHANHGKDVVPTILAALKASRRPLDPPSPSFLFFIKTKLFLVIFSPE